ncbi:MAG: RHS repeat protein, partial [bacterium]|nr:RHS repeat protein [bacterium]
MSEWIYDRDAAGKITAVTDPLGSTWTREYDDAGRLTRQVGPAGTTLDFGYDAHFRVTSAIVVDGVQDPVTSYTYDGSGRLATKTLPDGATWTYAYDGSSRMTGVTDPLSRSWTYARDLAGNVATVTHPGGQQVTMLRDTAGRLTQRTIPGGRIESFVYHAATGRLISAEANEGQGAWVGRLEWGYDNMGRPNKVETVVDTGTGEQSRSILLSYDSNGRLSTLASPGGETVTYLYDELDRLTRTVSTLYGVWTVWYDPQSGHRTQVMSGSQWKTWAYDEAGRMLEQRWDWPGHDSGDFDYTYDAEGRMLTAIDQTTGGISQTIQFNDLGLMDLFQETDSGVTTSTTLSYDLAGRVIGQTRTVDGGAPELMTFDWDDAGRLVYERKDDDIRLLTWDDNPDDPAAAQRVWRAPMTPNEATAEVLYGFDGRMIGLWGHKLDEDPYLLAEYRWAPILGDLALELTEADENDVTETRWAAAGLGGSYADLTDQFDDQAMTNPVLAADQSAEALQQFLGGPTPRHAAPFSLGAWAGVPGLGAGPAESALTEFVSGLVQLETDVAVGDEQRQESTLSAFGEQRGGFRDLTDDWLGQALFGQGSTGGSTSGAGKTAQSSQAGGRPTAGLNGYGEQDVPVTCLIDNFCMTNSGSALICACQVGPMYFAQATGPTQLQCCTPGSSGGGGISYCSYAYDTGSAFPTPSLRNPDISEGGVLLNNGEFIRSETDLGVFAPHGGLSFRRTYRSGVVYYGDLGNKWSHNWNEMVLVGVGNALECGNIVRWISADGTVIEFLEDSNGVFQTRPDALHRILRVGSGFQIRDSSGVVRKFSGSGGLFRLAEIRDGLSVVSLAYQDDRLHTISTKDTDTGDSIVRLNLTYNQDGRLHRVTSGLDSTQWVEYEYNDCAELIRVKRPPTELGYDPDNDPATPEPVYEPMIEYKYYNPSADYCTNPQVGHHMLETESVRQLNPMTSTQVTLQTLLHINYEQPPEGANSRSYLRVAGQCFGDKECPREATPDLEYSYTYHTGTELHETETIDHPIAGHAIVEMREYDSIKLLALLGDVGR